MSKLELQHINMQYRNRDALQDINLVSTQKEFLVIAGPSGCGKSTLLEVIAGLLEPTTGKVLIDDQDMQKITADQRGSAMVFQEAALFEHMSVYDNILYGLGKLTPELEANIMELADKLQIKPLLQNYAHALSGGQKQRVSIARALIHHPKFFLMDEPLQSLDEQLKRDLRLVIADLYQRMDATFLYVTHDQREAMTLGERMVLMNEGKIVQIGTPQALYQHPVSLFVATFMDKYRLNTFRGNWQEHHFEIHSEGNMIGAVRSEHIHVIENPITYDYTMNGMIRLVEELGSGSILHFHCDGYDFIINDGADRYHRGDTIAFGFNQANLMLFHEDGKRYLNLMD